MRDTIRGRAARTTLLVVFFVTLVSALVMTFAKSPPIIVLEPTGGRLTFVVMGDSGSQVQQKGPSAEGALRRDFVTPVLEFSFVPDGGGAPQPARHIVIEPTDKSHRLDIVGEPLDESNPAAGYRLTWTLTDRSGGEPVVTVFAPSDQTNTGKVPAELFEFPFDRYATFKEVDSGVGVRSVEIKIPAP